jgi:hypothetical protein
MKLSLLSSLLVSAASASEFLHLGRLIPPFEEADEFPVSSLAESNVTGSAFFTQLLDHDNPSKGTFQQKFWWNAQWWEGPGSPVSFEPVFPEVG